ncbi:hypothetical protein GETHLI_03210 [Geothrix limicola]|uniref:DUF4352 domain-containing protein n=1 Tax=Geothrix limicola TaxID=2927978 RepID=A0ABQ5QCP3_9BACT|nr:DUF4352 domain-containing protein [Geothrix limicola]GLH71819.1 hypothetical protein GETHLI_03210 [Geothrix limicola]
MPVHQHLLKRAALAFTTALILSGGLACRRFSGPRPVQMGERAANDQLALTLQELQFCEEMTSDLGARLTPAQSGALFAVVKLRLENLSPSPLTANEFDLRLEVEGQDQPLKAANMPAWPMLINRMLQLRLNPGETREASALFVVPKGKRLVQFQGPLPHALRVRLDLPAQAPPRRPMPRIGEPTEASGLQYTVHKVAFPEAVSDGLWKSSPKPGQKLCQLEVSVRNASVAAGFQVNPLNVEVLDAQGRRYSMGGLQLGYGHALELKTLKPGEEVRGAVLISVPKEAEIKTSFFRTGVVGPALEVAL